MSQYNAAVALWKSYHIETEAELDKYLCSFRILFAYNSGRIENEDITYHDTREIFENGMVTNYTGSPRALFEQQNQKLCYEFLRARIIEKTPLSVALIQEIHRILTGGTYDEHRYIENGERPGELKKHDYVTGIHEVGSTPDEVEADLTDLVEELNDAGHAMPLKAAAYLHARFEYIHPFADGNGRVGRTLMNYWLMTNGHPPLIVYNEDKAEYYAALQRYDEAEDLGPLLAFLEKETAKTWEKAIERSCGKRPARKRLEELEV